MQKMQAEDKALRWKAKAVARSRIIKKQQKRIRELTQSRQHWRQKYEALRQAYPAPLEMRAKRHQYGLLLVQLCVQWHRYGSMGLRACRHCVSVLLVSLGMSGRVPSVGTIRNWVCKCGCYQVEQWQASKPAGHEPWVIWVDESVVLGAESILLIVGLPLAQWRFDRPVRVEDVQVLSVEAQRNWKYAEVARCLARVQQCVAVAYVVSDQDYSLRRACEQVGLRHVPDCSHVLANALEHQYKHDAEFKSFIHWASTCRSHWAMSQLHVPFMPPAPRTKARFANVFPLVDWALAVRAGSPQQLAALPAAVQISLRQLDQYDALLRELHWMRQLSSAVFALLKTEGFHEQSLMRLEPHLSGPTPGPKAEDFRQRVEQYLQRLSQLRQADDAILCCSDVIESAFGKFKQKVHPRSPFGLSEFIFVLANFGPPLTQVQVRQALESLTLAQVNQKRPQGLGIWRTRKTFFAINGTNSS